MQPESSLSHPGSLVKVSVEVDGIPLHMFHHASDIYVAGTPGRAYVLAVTSRSDDRLEVVTSVDGRNTLKDETAGFRNAGMVIRPRHTYRFRGWRTDDDTTREFLFGVDHEESVAAQATGHAANRGVLGFAAFRELPPPRTTFTATYSGTAGYNWPSRDVTSPYRSPGSAVCNVAVASAGAASAGMDYDLSTGIGNTQDDSVGRTGFKRTGTPDVLTIRYASYEALVRQGIIKCCDPDPFPGNGYSRMRSPRTRA
jgi:hypothetical protein